MYNVIGDVKLRFLSITNFVYTFTYPEISCETEIFQSWTRLLPTKVTARASVVYSVSQTRSSAIAEGPRDASYQLKSCQLPRNSAETTYTTSPDQIDGIKFEV